MQNTNNNRPSLKFKKLKVLLMGGRQVGITSWMCQAADGCFDDSAFLPIGVSFRLKRINANYKLWLEKNINSYNRVQLGLPRTPSLENFYAIIIMLDLNKEDLLGSSIGFYKTGHPAYEEINKLQNDYPHLLIYFVGNKADLLNTKEEGWAKLRSVMSRLDKKLDYEQCFVTSAKTGYGVQACLDHLTKKFLSEYTIKHFIEDYTRQYEKDISNRHLPNWLYGFNAIQKQISNGYDRLIVLSNRNFPSKLNKTTVYVQRDNHDRYLNVKAIAQGREQHVTLYWSKISNFFGQLPNNGGTLRDLRLIHEITLKCGFSTLNTEPLNFHTIFSMGGRRTQTVLSNASIQNHICLNNFNKCIIRKGLFKTEFYRQWCIFLCCLQYGKSTQRIADNGVTEDNENPYQLAIRKKVYAIDGVLKCIFQFASPDLNTLYHTKLLPKSHLPTL